MNRAEPWILIVDDDVDICRNLTDILTDLGYRVDTAHDGPSALALAWLWGQGGRRVGPEGGTA